MSVQCLFIRDSTFVAGLKFPEALANVPVAPRFICFFLSLAVSEKIFFFEGGPGRASVDLVLEAEG